MGGTRYEQTEQRSGRTDREATTTQRPAAEWIRVQRAAAVRRSARCSRVLCTTSKPRMLGHRWRCRSLLQSGPLLILPSFPFPSLLIFFFSSSSSRQARCRSAGPVRRIPACDPIVRPGEPRHGGQCTMLHGSLLVMGTHGLIGLAVLLRPIPAHPHASHVWHTLAFCFVCPSNRCRRSSPTTTCACRREVSLARTLPTAPARGPSGFMHASPTLSEQHCHVVARGAQMRCRWCSCAFI